MIGREPVEGLYRTAGRDIAADGGDPAGGDRGVHAAPRVGAAGGRLSHDSGGDVLSWGEPGRGGDHGDGAAGAAVWRDAGAQPDDVDQLGWDVGDRAAVQPLARARRG